MSRNTFGTSVITSDWRTEVWLPHAVSVVAILLIDEVFDLSGEALVNGEQLLVLNLLEGVIYI